jgi:hypothetical protein
VLEKLFGKKPEGYLERLGKELDQKVRLFWTGEAVCSKSYTGEHLRSTAELLGRKPFLWDNYPVNDGPRMCKFLYLRAVTGRPSGMGEWLSAHSVNPMNQPTLSKIPLLTLKFSYEQEAAYRPEEAFLKAAEIVTCREMARQLEKDLPDFMDRGLDQFTEADRGRLKDAYTPYLDARENHASSAAREVIDWLNGRYTVSKDLFLTQ